MAEHEVRVQVPAGFDYIGICGIRLVAGLSRTTRAAVRSAYAENTCKNTRESLMTNYGMSAFYEKFGFARAEVPHATRMNRRI